MSHIAEVHAVDVDISTTKTFTKSCWGVLRDYGNDDKRKCLNIYKALFPIASDAYKIDEVNSGTGWNVYAKECFGKGGFSSGVRHQSCMKCDELRKKSGSNIFQVS